MENNLLRFSVDYMVGLYNNKDFSGKHVGLLKVKLLERYKGLLPDNADIVSIIINNYLDNYLNGNEKEFLDENDKSNLIKIIKTGTGDLFDTILGKQFL